jgi:hypothetical protein
MAIYEYELKSGQIVEIDSPTREKADKAFQNWQTNNTGVEEFEPKVTPAAWLSDQYNSVLSGVIKYGVAGTASIPGTLERLSTFLPGGQRTTGFDYSSLAPETLGKSETGRFIFPSYEQTLASLERNIPGIEKFTRFQPATRTGEYAETISGFVAPQSFVGTAPRLASKALSKGQTIGATETAKQTLSGTAAGATFEFIDGNMNDTLLAAGVSLPVALTVSALLSPSKAAKLSAEALKGVSKEEIALAVNLEKAANKQGIPMSAPELINNRVINVLGETIYGTNIGGGIMYNNLKDRPQALDRITQVLLNKITKDPDSIRAVNKKTEMNASKILKEAKQERTTAAFEAGYKISNDAFVPADRVANIITKIDSEIAKLPQGSKNINMLKKLKTRLTVPLTPQERKLGLDNIPVTNINKLDSVFKEFAEDVSKSNVNAAYKSYINSEGGRLLFNQGNGILDDLNALMKTNNSYAKANATYEKLSKEVVEFAADNIGKLNKNVSQATIKNFIFNADNASPIDVRNTYKLFNKTDKTNFPQLARIFIENQTNKMLLGESLGEGYNLQKALVGTGKKKANFYEVLRGVAESNNVKPNELIKGFENFNKVLEKTAKIGNIDRPGGASFADVFQKGVVKSVAQINSFMWRLKLATRLGEFQERKTVKQLADVFTTENSVQNLVKLAKENPNSVVAINRVRNLINVTMPVFKDAEARLNEQGFPMTEDGAELPALQ